MPHFTICNIGLGCPQNVSVKFQCKITMAKRAQRAATAENTCK